jgi:hypothetical protein
MKRFITYLALAVLLLFGASSAFAQNGAFAPYVDGSISLQSTGLITSTQNPTFNVGGGIESSTKHLLLDVNAQFSSGNASNLGGIFNSNGGYTGTATGSAYYKLGGFLVGGGALWSNQVAKGSSLYEGSIGSFNYQQVAPFIGGGYQFKYDRILVDYVLPVGTASLNSLGYAFTGSHPQQVNISNEIFLGTKGLRKHLRLTQNVNILSSNATLVTAVEGGYATVRGSQITAGAGLKFVF